MTSITTLILMVHPLLDPNKNLEQHIAYTIYRTQRKIVKLIAIAILYLLVESQPPAFDETFSLSCIANIDILEMNHFILRIPFFLSFPGFSSIISYLLQCSIWLGSIVKPKLKG